MKSPTQWKAKLVLIKHRLAVLTPAELAFKVYEHQPKLADRLPQNLKNWETSLPVREGGPKRFFNDVIPLLGCRAGVTGADIIQSRLDEFIGYFPLEEREACWLAISAAIEAGKIEEIDVNAADPMVAGLFDLEKSEPAPATAPSLAGNAPAPLTPRQHYFKINFASTWSAESVRDSIAAGRFDQKHYYLTPDAAAAWEHLVQADRYPTYEQCRLALKRLVVSDAWKEAIEASPPEAVVMLAGGGAPTKDIVIIDGLLGLPVMAGRSIIYNVLDVSPYMLSRTHAALKNVLSTDPEGDRVILEYFAEDVVALQAASAVALRRAGTALFSITGGTLGNLKEKAFFAALNKVSRPGDLLIVSADTVAAKPTPAMREALIRKYDHTELHRFIAPAMRNLARELRLVEDDSDLFKRVRVKLVDGDYEEYSDVPDSLSVTLWFETNGDDLLILTSTRYAVDAFVEFARGSKWSLITLVESPANSDYRQFLFRKSE